MLQCPQDGFLRYGLIPLYLKEGFGIANDGERGLYLSFFTFAGMFAYCVFNPIWGGLSDRFGVKPMLLRGTFVTSWMFALMAYVPSPVCSMIH